MVVTPFLLLLFGTVEVGRLVWTRHALQQTATKVARCIGIRQSKCTTTGSYDAAKTSTYLRAVASSFSIAVPAAGVTLSAGTSCAGVTGFSAVTINYTFQTAIPLLEASLSSGLPMTSTACFPNQS